MQGEDLDDHNFKLESYRLQQALDGDSNDDISFSIASDEHREYIEADLDAINQNQLVGRLPVEAELP